MVARRPSASPVSASTKAPAQIEPRALPSPCRAFIQAAEAGIGCIRSGITSEGGARTWVSACGAPGRLSQVQATRPSSSEAVQWLTRMKGAGPSPAALAAHSPAMRNRSVSPCTAASWQSG